MNGRARHQLSVLALVSIVVASVLSTVILVTLVSRQPAVATFQDCNSSNSADFTCAGVLPSQTPTELPPNPTQTPGPEPSQTAPTQTPGPEPTQTALPNPTQTQEPVPTATILPTETTVATATIVAT